MKPNRTKEDIYCFPNFSKEIKKPSILCSEGIIRYYALMPTVL